MTDDPARSSIKRFVAVYCKKTGNYVREISLYNLVEISELKGLFDVSEDDDQMYLCYEVNQKNLEKFKKITDCNAEFDFGNFDYDLEASS